MRFRSRLAEAECPRRRDDARLVLVGGAAARAEPADELTVRQQRDAAGVDDDAVSVVFQPQSAPPGCVLSVKSPVRVPQSTAVYALPSARRIAPSAAPSMRCAAIT